MDIQKMHRTTSEERSSAYKRFRKVAMLVKVVNILSKNPNDNSCNQLSDVTSYMTFSEYMDHVKQMSESYVRTTGFDPDLFKANRQLRLAKETKRLLMLPAEERTPSNIEKVLLTLRSIKAFSEYPKRMQKKLVEVCWYECHPKMKIIIQQGHRPRAFYFILSGKVSVKVLSKKEGFAKTVCYLERGKSFGELSIVHGTIRQATIITENETELMCVSKEDFIKIFMTSPEGKNTHDPDFFSFVREIKFMEGWPIELLQKKRQDCLFIYFKSGEVLVKDSRFSSWLYIVKSGSCDVLKKLQKVRSLPQHVNTEFKYGITRRPPINCKISDQRRVQSGIISSTRPLTTRSTNTGSTVAPRQSDNSFLVTKLNIKRKPQRFRQQSKKSNAEHVNQRITVLDDDASDTPALSEQPPDSKVCFVKIATLQKGQSFGLQDILHSDQPSLILISNGAEMLMVSKKLYQQHATRDMLLELQKTTPLFPGDKELQRELETTLHWEAFKKQQMDALLAERRVEKLRPRRCRTAHM